MNPITETANQAYEVIVIGGGFAGVTAARDCRKNGYATLLLEARDRLGGRTHTTRFEGHTVELGGTWIHWSQPHVWVEKERYGLAVKETPSAVDPLTSELVLRTDGRRVVLRGADALRIDEALRAYFAESDRFWERPFDTRHCWEPLLAAESMSALERLERMDFDPVQRAAVRAFADGIANGSAAEVAYSEVARWWALSGATAHGLDDACGRFALRDGTASLIDAMVADGRPEVRLDSQVLRVEDAGDRVRVHTADGQVFTARCAVVSLPMNVLPQVAFSPALDPERLQAATERHAGHGLKVIVKTRGPLEGASKRQGLGAPGDPLHFAFTYAKAEDHCLYVSFGPDPARLDVNDCQQVQEAMRLFFPDIEVQACTGHDWSSDPFSLGTWANYRTHWISRYESAFRRDHGRVLFGMGDHGEGWRGFIDGAIAAGSQAAMRVRRMLDAPIPTSI